MDRKDIKSFKLTKTDEKGNVETYLYKFRADSTTNWSKQLFHIYAITKYSDCKYDLSNDSASAVEKEQYKKQYLELIKNFLNDIKVNKNYYYIENVKVTENTHLSGYHNKNNFYLDKNDIFTISTPSFKNIDLKMQYYFEKELFDANVYLNDIWISNKVNPYLKDKKFIKELEDVLAKAKNNDKFKHINNENLKTELLINPLKSRISHIEHKDVKEKLLKTLDKNELTIGEYERMEDFVFTMKQLDRLKEPDVYNNNVINHFKDYLLKNDYLIDLYTNSISKEELIKLLNYKDTNEIEKSVDLKKKILYRFLVNHSKKMTDLFLENSILSLDVKKDKQSLEPELERD